LGPGYFLRIDLIDREEALTDCNRTHVSVAKTIQEVCEQGECHEEGHESGGFKFQAQGTLIFSDDGGLNESSEAFVRRSTVAADTPGLQGTPVDVGSKLLPSLDIIGTSINAEVIGIVEDAFCAKR
jgi:hypothetical protein